MSFQLPASRRLFLALTLFGLAAIAPACTTAQARSKPADMPPMNVPAPPPRAVAPPTPAEPPPEPVTELPPAVPPASRTRPSATRDTAREAPKPEPRPETPPESGGAPLPQTPAQPSVSVPPLRTPSTADDQSAARNTRAVVDRARGMLNAIDYRQLSVERKAQYDTAKRFIEQADDAIKSGNYVYAQSLGEKAETIAKELAGK